MTSEDRAGWGRPVPGRCPQCGGLDLQPRGGQRGQTAPDGWRCRDCGAEATRDEVAAAAPVARGDGGARGDGDR